MKTFNLLVIIAALSACQSAETVGRTSTMSPGPQTMESIYARTPCDDLSIDQAANRERDQLFATLPTSVTSPNSQVWQQRLDLHRELFSFEKRYEIIMAKTIAECPPSTLPERADVMYGRNGIKGGSRDERRASNLESLKSTKSMIDLLEETVEIRRDFERTERQWKTDKVGDVLMGAIVGAGVIAGAYNSAQASTPRSTSGGSSGAQCRPYDGTCSRNDPNYAQCMALPRCAP